MRIMRGMTLLEVVVWVSITTLILLALLSSVLYFYRTNKYAIEQASAVTSAQRGTERIVRTIREAAYSSEGAFPIVSISENQFIFYADIDSDALIERVRYFIQGTTLKQGITDATGNPPGYTGAEIVSDVADYLHNLDQEISLFQYYDQNGAEITNYANWGSVRFVKVNVATNVDPNILPSQLTLGSSAALRNLVGK